MLVTGSNIGNKYLYEKEPSQSKDLATKVLEMLEQDMAESSKITKAEEFYKTPKLHSSLPSIGYYRIF